jgi:hypothetical protein
MYRLHRDASDFFTLLEIIQPSLELSASSKRAAIKSSGSFILPAMLITGFTGLFSGFFGSH